MSTDTLFCISRQATVEINLSEVIFADWPDEAKQIAYLLLEKPGIAAKLATQPRKIEWLAARVAAKQRAMQAVAEWLAE